MAETERVSGISFSKEFEVVLGQYKAHIEYARGVGERVIGSLAVVLGIYYGYIRKIPDSFIRGAVFGDGRGAWDASFGTTVRRGPSGDGGLGTGPRDGAASLSRSCRQVQRSRHGSFVRPIVQEEAVQISSGVGVGHSFATSAEQRTTLYVYFTGICFSPIVYLVLCINNSERCWKTYR